MAAGYDSLEQLLAATSAEGNSVDAA
jgi:hypothetical protein